MNRTLRFGLQVNPDGPAAMRDTAREAESAGFDVISTWDHLGSGWPPLSPLLAMAEATQHIRVCPLVLNNDFWHPVHLAREVAAIDQLSGGRVELGLGAGHAFPEYASLGAPFDPAPVRKQRLAEAVEIIRALLSGEPVSFHGSHYTLEDAQVMRPAQERVPILVGVQGKSALAHAAAHADVIGLTMLGKTLADGQRHEVRWQAEKLTATVEHIRQSAQAVQRPLPELQCLVQRVQVTEDREQAAVDACQRSPGMTLEDALATPFMMLGSHQEMAAHILRVQQRWGISYFTVRDLAAFAPVIRLLRGTHPA